MLVSSTLSSSRGRRLPPSSLVCENPCGMKGWVRLSLLPLIEVRCESQSPDALHHTRALFHLQAAFPRAF